MSGEWQKGDLALCVKAPPLVGFMSGARQNGLVKGRVYLVEGVKHFDEFSATGLQIEGFVGWIISDLFRRIPPHAPDAEDAETIRILNGAPVPVEA